MVSNFKERALRSRSLNKFGGRKGRKYDLYDPKIYLRSAHLSSIPAF